MMLERNNRLNDVGIGEWLDRMIDSDAALVPSINAFWLPAMVLAEHDPERCRRLLAAVLRQQREDGLLVDATAQRPPDGDGTAAWPLWSCVAERAQRGSPDAAWLRDVLPALQRAFLAAMNHFDPERHGLPCWRSASEAWDAREFRPNRATPDVAALLLMEVDALQRLRGSPDARLIEERETLKSGLLEFMVDPERECFDARRVGGGREPVSTRMAVFPLLWSGLPGAWVGRLLKHADDGLIQGLRAAGGHAALTEIWMWRQTSIRVGAWGLLKRIDDAWRRKTFAALTVQPPLPPARAAWDAAIKSVQAERVGRGGRTRRIVRRLSRRVTAPGMVAALCLILAAGWGMFGYEPSVDAATLSLWQREALTATVLGCPEADREVNAALTAAGVFEPFGDMLGLQLAEQRGDWETAAALYQQLRQRDGDSPLIIFGLARAKQRLGETQAARDLWSLFIERHGDAFPTATRAVYEAWWSIDF